MLRFEDRTVVEVVENPLVRRINFKFGPVRISGGDYLTIARAIRHHRIACEVNAEYARYGAGAYVHDGIGVRRNIIRIPFQQAVTPAEQALIVHECTHAIEDYHGVPLQFLDSEGAAFLAQTMYGHLATSGGLPFSHPDLRVMDIFTEAHLIAQRILTTRGGYEVTDRERERLRNAIGMVDGYHNRRNSSVDYNRI